MSRPAAIVILLAFVLGGTPWGCAAPAAGPAPSVPEDRPVPSTIKTSSLPGDPVKGAPHSEESLGVRFWIPEGWERADHSSGPAKAIVFSPSKDILTPRFTLLVIPEAFWPKGMLTREMGLRAVAGDKYERRGYEDSEVAGRPGKVLKYEVRSARVERTFEYGTLVEGRHVVLQTSAYAEKWEESEETFSRIIKSAELFEPTPAAPGTPAERPKPPAERPKPPELSEDTVALRHIIDLVVDPPARSLITRCGIRIRAEKAGVERAEFMISKLAVMGVSDTGGSLEFEVDEETEPWKLTVLLRQPLKEKEELELAVVLQSEDYTFRITDSPVPNYVMLGQVREDSSFSSHVVYYPLDSENRAPASLSIEVPQGYTAVGPGRLLRTEERESTVVFHWETSFSGPKQLPWGWAVGKYGSLVGESKSATPIRVYHHLGSEEHAREIMRVAVDAVDFYESAFGEFPFEGISIAQVTPEEGMTGVSLPSLVLISSLFFEGETSYEELGKSVESALGALVVADEISHQYNFYSVSFPNALAEGLASYTDTLFAEHVVGPEVLAPHLDDYKRYYLGSIAAAPDHPIMSREIYGSGAYMGVVFSKGAFVVHMLRRLVGDKAFFGGLKETFTKLRGKSGTLDDFRAGFESTSGLELKWFFDQWYHRSGYPRLRITQRFILESSELEVEIEQRQEGKPFRLPLRLEIEGGGVEEIELDAPRKTHRIKVEDASARVSVANAGDLLAEVEIP